MNRKTLPVVAAIALAILSITFSALTAMNVFAAPSSELANQTQAQPAQNSPRPGSTKWEYRILKATEEYYVEQAANKLSAQGFEVFAFEIEPGFIGTDTVRHDPQFVMVLRRPKY